jgi:hypothetical protein
MRIRIDRADLRGDLARRLGENGDAIVMAVGVHELEVSLLGSLSDRAHQTELLERIGAWRAGLDGAARGVEITFV